MKAAFEAKKALEEDLQRHFWVLGIGVGRTESGETGLRISVNEDVPEYELASLPCAFKGFPVQVVRLQGAFCH